MEKHSIECLMQDEKYSFINNTGKVFIADFDNEMNKIGYTSNSNICNGFCWGKYMIIYTKAGVKSQKSYARIYIQENGSVYLRMYFSNVDKHKETIEKSPDFIQNAFTSGFGACKHCHNQKEDGICSHRKTYTLNSVKYEICDGYAFYFKNPDSARIRDYVRLFKTFYPEKKLK